MRAHPTAARRSRLRRQLRRDRPGRALKLLQQPETVLIDVRTADEFAEGALPGAVRVETPDLARHIGALAPAKDTPIVVYCRSGRRSSAAQDVLEGLGYSRIVNAGAYETLAPAFSPD